MKKKIQLLLTVMLFSFSASAQTAFFKDTRESEIQLKNNTRANFPDKYRTLRLDLRMIRDFLSTLPAEQNILDRDQTPVLVLPMPDGSMSKFHVWESSIQEPGLQEKFPEIRTYAGQGIDDRYATIRFDVNPYDGFHAQILSPDGRVYIDPYRRDDLDNYISYYQRDNHRDHQFICEGPELSDVQNKAPNNTLAGACRGTQLYTYRLAVACTGEYAVALSATTAAMLHSKIVTSVNRVDGVYESELSVRLVLVATNDLIEFLDPATDPFTGNNNANTLITQSQTQITTRIGSANFDIGHTFSTGAGGLAGLGVVCNTTNKARGVTGNPSPAGDGYDIDYVAHEIGHQFGGNHTFNGTTSNCSGANRNASTAYEPGSGTTIQAYAGICGIDDTQPHSDPYFHSVSFDEISTFVDAGGSCKTFAATGNTLPAITAMNNNGANIPLNTPFTLTGAATDANGDAITYDWEEWDLGPQGLWNAGGATAPLFKSRIPKTTGSRTFPDIAVILAGYPAAPSATMDGLKGETLPTVARAIKFRLTVRDNRAGGGAVVTGGNGCQTGFTGTFQVNTIAATGPFVVTAPNGGENYAGNSVQLITWNTAGTNGGLINTTNVKISLSTDGGFTYPNVIIASTPNDGSESLMIPNLSTTTARIKVEAVGNIFFDISNNNFSITAASGITLNLKFFVQGYYISANNMQPVLNNQSVPSSLTSQTDTVIVELHHPTTYALIDSKKAVLLTNGTVSATFAQPAGSYYIGIRHRNTLQTWSAGAVACSASTPLYDFSTAANKAFGNNQVQVAPGIWAFFTGDINQDEYIDGNDFPLYDSESASGGLYDGTYTVTDMNGDGFVDGNDFPVYDVNSSNGVSSIHL
ncbi:MAG: reprolysin-like metallopeptidase [Ferruginibacter sp.]